MLVNASAVGIYGDRGDEILTEISPRGSGYLADLCADWEQAAQAAESLNDFVHKLKICLKELRESHRWLRLIKRVPLIEKPVKVDPLIDETDQLIRIFVSSLRKVSSRQNSSSRVAEDAPESDSELSMFDVRCSMFDVQPPAGPPRKSVTYAPKKRAQSQRKSP